MRVRLLSKQTAASAYDVAPVQKQVSRSSADTQFAILSHRGKFELAFPQIRGPRFRYTLVGAVLFQQVHAKVGPPR